MSRLFIRDPFDIAPLARRYTAASWVVLAMGLLAAGAGLWHLTSSALVFTKADDAYRASALALRDSADRQRKDRLRQSGQATLASVYSHYQRQDQADTAWAGMFDALEIAALNVRGGVSIITLVPSKVQVGSLEMEITALAVNPDIMLKYLAVLQRDARVRQVEIAAQQSDDKQGGEVVRFQFNIRWDAGFTVSTSSVSKR
jgi:hypothetical protein